MSHLELLIVTKDGDIAAQAQEAGVDIIFVDLEILGKEERQKNRSTVIARHTWDDVVRLRQILKTSKLLVRIDPPHEHTCEQVRKALDLGADLVRLPKFTKASQLEAIDRFVQGKPCVLPLVETTAALVRLRQFAGLPCIQRIHLGLNDLHIQLGLDFLFEPLAGGLGDLFAEGCKEAGKPFGIGGVARIGAGALPAEDILSEHARLGSTGAILSRAFHGGANDADSEHRVDLNHEVSLIRSTYTAHLARPASEVDEKKKQVHEAIWKVARSMV